MNAHQQANQQTVEPITTILCLLRIEPKPLCKYCGDYYSEQAAYSREWIKKRSQQKQNSEPTVIREKDLGVTVDQSIIIKGRSSFQVFLHCQTYNLNSFKCFGIISSASIEASVSLLRIWCAFSS